MALVVKLFFPKLLTKFQDFVGWVSLRKRIIWILSTKRQTAMGAGEDQGVGQVEEAGMGEGEQDDTDVKKEQASTVEVMSPEMEAELLDLVVSLGNVTCTFNIGCGLNLVELVLHGVNVEMKVGFHLNLFSPFTILLLQVGVYNRITMKTPLGSDPEATATIFKSGKINVVGGRSEPEAKAVSRQFARRIQKLSWKRPEILADKNQRVSFNNFRIHNVFASVALPFDVKLREFASSRKDDNKCSYEPELNSAVVFQIPEPKASVSIRSTGHLTMQGSKVTAVYSALSTLYPLLRPFGKPKKKKPAAKKEKPKKGADKMWRC